MTANVVNQVPYLRTSRNFPEDLHQLTVEMNKSYVDVANAVNNRTIGIFPTNRPAVNGESWFFTNLRQQGLRQVFTFTATGTISTGLSINTVQSFSKAFGSFTDGTNYYGAIYASNVAIAGQVSFYISLSSGLYDIVILSGAGAPSITTGIIVLEWLSNV